jgi:hypothetical protein
MFAMKERLMYADNNDKDAEIERLKIELMICSQTSNAVERDLRIRLSVADREIAQLRDRLHDSESAIRQMRSNFDSIEAERVSRRIEKRACMDSFGRLGTLSFSGNTSAEELHHGHEGESDIGDLEEEERALARGSEAAGDAMGSSDCESESKESLLLQNPNGLNVSTFIPVAKKRKLSYKSSSDGTIAETKEEHWETMFSLLLQFDAEHKHCNVPQRYKFILSNGSTPCLGRWLQFQRVLQRKNRMRADRLARMQALVDSGKLFWDFNL